MVDELVDRLTTDGHILVFVEAKLGSDVSPSTRYDPDRDQIVRNIDCLIEEAGDVQAFFWMLVRDRDPSRLYMRRIEEYRNDPGELQRLIPASLDSGSPAQVPELYRFKRRLAAFLPSFLAHSGLRTCAPGPSRSNRRASPCPISMCMRPVAVLPSCERISRP